MKDLKTIAQNFNPATLKKTDDIIIDDFAKNIINKVFDQLSVIFPAWKHAWPTEKELSLAKMEWTKAFNENDIKTLEQIKYGFAKARKSESDFLPSCQLQETTGPHHLSHIERKRRAGTADTPVAHRLTVFTNQLQVAKDKITLRKARVR